MATMHDYVTGLMAELGKTMDEVADVVQSGDEPNRWYVLLTDETYITITTSMPPEG